jgi:hypothetical protein
VGGNIGGSIAYEELSSFAWLPAIAFLSDLESWFGLFCGDLATFLFPTPVGTLYERVWKLELGKGRFERQLL